MFVSIEVFVFWALWIHFWGMVQDEYAGRSSKADWFFSHVIEGLRRESLFIAVYAILIRLYGVPDPLIVFLLILLHGLAWWLGSLVGKSLRRLIEPENDPVPAESNIMKLAIGVIGYLIWEILNK